VAYFKVKHRRWPGETAKIKENLS